MKKHLFANHIRFEYWCLYRELRTKNEWLKLEKALQSYLHILETEELVERLGAHNRQVLVNPESLSALSWELFGIDSEIQNINRFIKHHIEYIRKIDIPLG